ncbi:50S ribosomal protein L2 [Candidatus Woesearchaeota archaeon]|nr:50S ribosomal protein L2 [Candidatus Woesearchaeota archaeon]
MGKNLIQQRRGRGTSVYRAPSHRYKGFITHKPFRQETAKGVVTDLIHCAGHSAPLATVRYEDGEQALIPAAEGLAVGEAVMTGTEAEERVGNTMHLKNIPEGTLIYNIELNPGDGGKFVRSSGTFARVVAKTKGMITVLLPSKKRRDFLPDCRATIGIIAGSGRPEKPFVKAGKKYHAARAKNKLYPRVAGLAMNAVDHPFGGSRTSKKGKPTVAPRNAPPGRKVGKIRPRRTGWLRR